VAAKVPSFVESKWCGSKDAIIACSNKFEEGGFCTKYPISPFCDPKYGNCGKNFDFEDETNRCTCCRNCYDVSCSTFKRGWQCQNATTAASSKKPCIQSSKFCRGASLNKPCYCCPPEEQEPQECEPASNCPVVQGYECTKKSEITTEECFDGCKNSDDAEDPCLCCKKCGRSDLAKRCAEQGSGYTCVSNSEASTWPVPCPLSCSGLDTASGDDCKCCPPKPDDCMDTGCSRKGDGYECKTEKEASLWQRPCEYNTSLCIRGVPIVVNITVDNGFNLYSGLPSAGDTPVITDLTWASTSTITLTAPEFLAVAAANDGSYDRGILLETSDGVVSDASWRCCSVRSDEYWKTWLESGASASLPWDTWDNCDPALEIGNNGVGPWLTRPGISASAKWIWAPPNSLGVRPNKVWCVKKLERGKCFCCPPVPPVNDCSDTGCSKIFGPDAVGVCKDISNPNWQAISQEVDVDLDPPYHEEPLCKASLDDGCCRCFKKKLCQDRGCKDAFGGQGVCKDTLTDNLADVYMTDSRPGLCYRPGEENSEKCCTCFRKKTSDPYCHNKVCSYKNMAGVCLTEGTTPPRDHVKTEGYCGGYNCACWVKDTCSDPACEITLHGKCREDREMFSPAWTKHYRPSDYKCKSLSKNCTCWTPFCENPTCKEKGGVCVLPWETAPDGYERSDLVCNNELKCLCYIKQQIECTQTRECSAKDGTCRDRSLPSPIDEEDSGESCLTKECGCFTKKCTQTRECSAREGTCRDRSKPAPADEVDSGESCQTKKCGCFIKIKKCENRKCELAHGICVQKGETPPSSRFYAHKTGDWCDKGTSCKCYRPKCSNSTCAKKYKGRCFIKGQPIPDGYKAVLAGKKTLLLQQET